jgi:diadenosine tetraphosphatase ApaH/serine/threonine PP2A family protein phosphatase
MRVAVISDIHANLHALVAVLADVETERADELWFLGDLVGYGPRPNECCAVLRDRVDLALVGNHDLVALGTIGIEDFNHDAAAAAEWTRARIDDDTRAFLSDLQPTASVEHAQLFHASARDPIWEYVLTLEAATATFSLTSAELVLVGHSHVALDLALADDGLAQGGLAPGGTKVELAGRRRLLNPGSVGQPRDGDPRAAWLLLDFEARFASFRRVAYPIERTQSEMRDAGLPDGLAARLAGGQ